MERVEFVIYTIISLHHVFRRRCRSRVNPIIKSTTTLFQSDSWSLWLKFKTELWKEGGKMIWISTVLVRTFEQSDGTALALYFSWTISYARARTKRNVHCASSSLFPPSFPPSIPFIITWNGRERYLRKIWVDHPSGIEASPSSVQPLLFPQAVTFSLVLLVDRETRVSLRGDLKKRDMSNLAD